jgi:hypothetical protein
VLEGLFGHESEFVRTPKYNIQKAEDLWTSKIYAHSRGTIWITYAVFSLYSLLTLTVAVFLSRWVALPFISMFLAGFVYMASLCVAHSSTT